MLFLVLEKYLDIVVGQRLVYLGCLKHIPFSSYRRISLAIPFAYLCWKNSSKKKVIYQAFTMLPEVVVHYHEVFFNCSNLRNYKIPENLILIRTTDQSSNPNDVEKGAPINRDTSIDRQSSTTKNGIFQHERKDVSSIHSFYMTECLLSKYTEKLNSLEQRALLICFPS